MHPQRRIRMLLLAVLAIVIFILYITGDARRVQNQRLYQQTAEAMDAEASRKQYEEEADLFQKLRPGVGEERVVAVERQRYDNPLKKDPVIEGDIENPEEASVERGKTMPGPADAPPEPEKGEGKEDPEVDDELNAILKRSPIIIFSKSYCPFSQRAKAILLEQYDIVPPVFVVELNEHPLGPKLQASLAENTGRGTVPNVLVNGRSIGGGNEIEALDASGELSKKIKEFAGKRVMQVTRKEENKKAL